MKITIGMGIRPDTINECLLIPALEREFGRENVIVIHNGQHYSLGLDGIFFKELGLREPDYRLDISRRATPTAQAAETILKSEEILVKEKPDLHISFSDANPCLMALAATKNFIKVLHIEAGMRAYDWRMQEEKNRRMVDSISDYFFCPTNIARLNLLDEGYRKDRISVTGKLIIDVIEHFREVWQMYPCPEEEYALVTLHRPENVEDYNNFSHIMKGIGLVQKKYGIPIIAPLHPRTQEAIRRFGIKIPKGVDVVDPIGFLKFTRLESKAKFIITDSGTVEEDACWFGVPCITTRMSTERPETVNEGANKLVGEKDGTFLPTNILGGVDDMMAQGVSWDMPYEKGATERMVKIIKGREYDILKRKIQW